MVDEVRIDERRKVVAEIRNRMKVQLQWHRDQSPRFAHLSEAEIDAILDAALATERAIGAALDEDSTWAHVVREQETWEPALLDDEALAVVNQALAIHGSRHLLDRSWIRPGPLLASETPRPGEPTPDPLMELTQLARAHGLDISVTREPTELDGQQIVEANVAEFLDLQWLRERAKDRRYSDEWLGSQFRRWAVEPTP